MSQPDPFARLVTSIHEAALDDACWPATSALIDEACGSQGNGLMVGEGSEDRSRAIYLGLYYRGERRQDLERDYLESYYHWDERVPRVRTLPDSHLARVADLYTQEELKASPTFNEYLPRSNGQDGLNIRLDGPPDSRIVVIFRNPAASDGWQSDQLETIRCLLPHVRQFVRVRQALAGADALGSSLTDVLDNNRVGVVHLDRRGRIVGANDRALSVLRQGDGLADRGGFLRARRPEDNARLEKFLASALLPSGMGAASASMSVERPSNLPRLALHISPVPAGTVEYGAQRVAALVLIGEPGSRPRIDPDLLAETLCMTPMESRVAALLAEGRSIRDIAAAMKRQQSSIRAHVKRMFRKQGVARQSELVRLVLSLAGFTRTPSSNSAIRPRRNR